MFVLFLLNLQSASAYFAFGSCPKPALQPSFNLTNYLGLWYDIVHTTDFIWEIGGECDVAQYSPSSTAGQIHVYNSEYKDGAWQSNEGTAECQASAPAHCGVKFFKLAPYGDYEVVQTDYNNYSLVFSCMNNGIGHDMWAWVLARTPNYNPTSLIPKIKSFGFPDSEITYTNQTACPSPPTPPSEEISIQ